MDSAVSDLRSLYRSSRRMARSDEVMLLFDYLVEDIVSCTSLDRLLVLRLDEEGRNLESQVYYGFQEVSKNPFYVPFKQVNGLLRKVYKDKEPLNVVGFPEVFDDNENNTQACGILRDDYRGNHEQNRRQRVNLCVPELTSGSLGLSDYSRFRHFSVMDLDVSDKTIRFLLGDVSSFLIMPICDGSSFYGYVLADKSVSKKPITYDEIRLVAALAGHSAVSVGRAVNHKGMLRKIARQLAEIDYLKSFYESIIQNLRSGLISVDQFMNITDVNKAAEIILGFKRRELVERPLDDFLVPPDGKKCFFLDSADEVDASMGLLSEVPMKRKNGEIFPSEVCFSVIEDSNDTVIGLSCIFRDITARKVLEQDLARVDKLASLGEMAAGVAHEIKNPLAGISGAMQILARSFNEDDTNLLIFNEVQSQVKRLDGFVNNLLQFARPAQTQFAKIQLDEILEKILLLSASQMEEKSIGIERQYEDNPLVVHGDDGQLQQVFLNIVLNAIDAMEKDGKLSVGIGWEENSNICQRSECLSGNCGPTKGHVVVSITDTGGGIEPDAMETIFNPFYTTKASGTGLGLSISHRILEQHGGSIAVESEPGVGTTFYVCLPVCELEDLNN